MMSSVDGKQLYEKKDPGNLKISELLDSLTKIECFGGNFANSNLNNDMATYFSLLDEVLQEKLRKKEHFSAIRFVSKLLKGDFL